jgi:hypothetical protein
MSVVISRQAAAPPPLARKAATHGQRSEGTWTDGDGGVGYRGCEERRRNNDANDRGRRTKTRIPQDREKRQTEEQRRTMMVVVNDS